MDHLPLFQKIASVVIGIAFYGAAEYGRVVWRERKNRRDKADKPVPRAPEPDRPVGEPHQD
jgi:hypothetical protein